MFYRCPHTILSIPTNWSLDCAYHILATLRIPKSIRPFGSASWPNEVSLGGNHHPKKKRIMTTSSWVSGPKNAAQHPGRITRLIWGEKNHAPQFVPPPLLNEGDHKHGQMAEVGPDGQALLDICYYKSLWEISLVVTIGGNMKSSWSMPGFSNPWVRYMDKLDFWYAPTVYFMHIYIYIYTSWCTLE